MSLYFKDNKLKINSSNDLLSTTKNREPILDITYKVDSQLQSRLKQKKIIKIYIEDNKFFIEHAAAFALRIVNTRAIMTDTPKLVEISYDMHNKLKNNDELEIEYIKIENKNKLSLKVYYDGNNYYLDNAAAYALGLIDVQELYNSDKDNYHYIDEEMLNYLENQYNIEIHSLNLANEISNFKK